MQTNVYDVVAVDPVAGKTIIVEAEACSVEDAVQNAERLGYKVSGAQYRGPSIRSAAAIQPPADRSKDISSGVARGILNAVFTVVAVTLLVIGALGVVAYRSLVAETPAPEAPVEVRETKRPPSADPATWRDVDELIGTPGPGVTREDLARIRVEYHRFDDYTSFKLELPVLRRSSPSQVIPTRDTWTFLTTERGRHKYAFNTQNLAWWTEQSPRAAAFIADGKLYPRDYSAPMERISVQTLQLWMSAKSVEVDLDGYHTRLTPYQKHALGEFYRRVIQPGLSAESRSEKGD